MISRLSHLCARLSIRQRVGAAVLITMAVLALGGWAAWGQFSKYYHISTELLCDGRSTSLGPTWSPDGRQLALFYYEVPFNTRYLTSIRILSWDDQGTMKVRKYPASGRNIPEGAIWSQDGSRIALYTCQTELEVTIVNLSDRNVPEIGWKEPFPTRDRSGGPYLISYAHTVAWSPDSTMMALLVDLNKSSFDEAPFVRPPRTTYVQDATTGKSVPGGTAPVPVSRAIAWSRDNRLAILCPKEVVILSREHGAATLKMETILPLPVAFCVPEDDARHEAHGRLVRMSWSPDGTMVKVEANHRTWIYDVVNRRELLDCVGAWIFRPDSKAIAAAFRTEENDKFQLVVHPCPRSTAHEPALERTFPSPLLNKDYLWCLIWSADGKRVVGYHYTPTHFTGRLWETSSATPAPVSLPTLGTTLWERSKTPGIKTPYTGTSPNQLSSTEWTINPSPDGERIAFTSSLYVGWIDFSIVRISRAPR